jgi:prevent-host-death family protein
MTSIPHIVPITDLRQGATSIVKRVSTTREPVFITQRGRATAVVISMESYVQSRKELELMRLLAKGEQEIQTGKGYDIDDVMGEADALLASLQA